MVYQFRKEKALQSLTLGGYIALIGDLSGFPESIPIGPIFGSMAHVTAIYVGSRADFEAMNAFIAEHDVHPVIDRVFGFDEAPAAFELMRNGDYMGKIVIRL